MQTKKAYTNLAEWFEYLNDDCDYENWSQYLIMKLNRFPLVEGIDVGCGAGWFTRAFQRRGYKMTGMDVSPQMLDVATRNAMESGVRSDYILGDIANSPLQKKYDFVTAINDCINYIPKTRLSRAFKHVAGGLKKGGVFLFDISSPRKFTQKIANTVSVDDREEVTYLAFNRLEGDVATLDVTLFVQDKAGKYTRLDETHVQYVYTQEEIESALRENGFTLLEVEGHFGEAIESSDRICFLAKKA